MALTRDAAAALAARLEIPLDDGICLLCLTIVSSAIHEGRPAAVHGRVRSMTFDLWSDGLDVITVRHLRRAAAAGDADAPAALEEVEALGPRSGTARAIVRELAERLAARERAGFDAWEEARRNGRVIIPDLN
jgi:hypothetical protein